MIVKSDLHFAVSGGCKVVDVIEISAISKD